MSITLNACGKINLTLEALAMRDDGYHEIVSVIQAISLADSLCFELADSRTLTCNVSELESNENLVLKAFDLLKSTTGCEKGAKIHLHKEIPIAAGLGSGATDAAATLIVLNLLWQLNLPPKELLELASKLGSDIPFFLYGGTAVVAGRGEIVDQIKHPRQFWAVLIEPAIKPLSGKTAFLYSKLQPEHFTSGQHTERLLKYMQEEDHINSSLLFNVFEHVAYEVFPGLSRYRSQFLEAGAQSVRVAGAGPCLFSVVEEKSEGEAILNRLEADGLKAYLVYSVDTSPFTTVSDSPC